MLEYRTDTIHGFSLHSCESGQGEPLVFLHGWSQHSFSSRGLQAQLARHYRVISPSHLGFGRSSDLPAGQFSLADFGKLYAAWLQQRGLRNVTLVGHSLGGAIAQVVAAVTPPGTIQRLFLLDSLGSAIPRSAGGWAGEWVVKEARNILVAPRRQLRYLTYPFIRNLLTKPRSLAQLGKLSTSLDTLEFARQITVPTLLVWGTADRFIPLVVGKTLQGLIPDAHLVTVPGGHDWPLLHPERLVPLIQ